MIDSTSRAPGRGARALKRAGIALGVVLVALFGAHIAWTNSGSNEWQLVSDQDGIRVSALKTPGYSLMKYKVNVRFDANLSEALFMLTDLDTGKDFGATDIKRIEEVSTPSLFYAYDTYKLTLPKPFGQVEVVLLNQCYEDPKTKQFHINVYAAPNRIPRAGDIPRIVHLSNNWTLTPVEGGVDVESVSEMDLGLPYVLANLAMPEVIGGQIKAMREVMKTDRYKHGKPVLLSSTQEPR
ncbi:hypothetical protein [Steroidobacter cummioxidans]|uniref:hypothetical protein n=1 Tax=Steroidobacter cummioxidans TaxID=1803913 RepID=UPI000E30FF53|nr:hypothetical protein [Steroidobacter cummioxidans]